MQTPLDAGERRLLISIIRNIVDVLANDKLGSVADALDALAGLCGSNEGALSSHLVPHASY